MLALSWDRSLRLCLPSASLFVVWQMFGRCLEDFGEICLRSLGEFREIAGRFSRYVWEAFLGETNENPGKQWKTSENQEKTEKAKENKQEIHIFILFPRNSKEFLGC